IGGEAPMLKKVTGSRKVVDPRACLFSPRLIAVEPLPVRTKSKAGRLADQGLMSRFVDHDAINPVQKLRIRRWLKRSRRARPRRCCRRGHGLRRGEVLSVD